MGESGQGSCFFDVAGTTQAQAPRAGRQFMLKQTHLRDQSVLPHAFLDPLTARNLTEQASKISIDIYLYILCEEAKNDVSLGK